MTKPPRNEAAERAVRDLLTALGQDPNREGLRDTPRRVAAAFAEMTAGEHERADEHLEVTFDGGSYDEVIALTGIPFTSLCEHHLLPFTGTASIAYLPGVVLPVELAEGEDEPEGASDLAAWAREGATRAAEEPEKRYRVVGLSKLARVVDVYARRLQLQEQLTSQVAGALRDHLHPRGVAVRMSASHGCMECRGAMKPGARMHTQVLLGEFRTNDVLRAEVLGLLSV